MPDKRFLLVDGTAMAYRAFFAIPGLSKKDGSPTNALFGFIKLLNQLMSTWQPSHACVAFDAGLPAERMELLPTYKAQRAEMPDDLRRQFAMINDYLAAARFPAVRVEGEEADDVMATLTGWAEAEDAEILLATSDKDMMQLVSGRVSMIPLTKSGEKMGPAEVQAKTGVPPRLVAQWLALIGDASDNIPGVPGVGEKTAGKLLQQYGDVPGVMVRLNEVKPDRIREALATSRDVVDRNIRMMTLRTHLAVPRNWEAYLVGPPDAARLLGFLEEMELHSLAREAADRMSRLF